jgi:phage anti-repressor protein
LSRNIAPVIFDRLKDSEELIRHEVRHSLLKSSIPIFLQDMNLVKYSIEIVQNLSRGLNEHCTSIREQKLIMAKDIVYTLAIANSSATSARQMVKLLDVDRQNFKRSFEWIQALDSSNDALWISYKRVRRSDALIETVHDLVVQFWTTETTVSPNEKDIIQLRVGVKKFVEHAKHYLHISQVLSSLNFMFLLVTS